MESKFTVQFLTNDGCEGNAEAATCAAPVAAGTAQADAAPAATNGCAATTGGSTDGVSAGATATDDATGGATEALGTQGLQVHAAHAIDIVFLSENI